MTDEEHKDLSDRLFATSGFEWLPGMQHDRRNDDRVVSVLPFVPPDEEGDGYDGCIRVTRKQWAYTDWDIGPQHDPFPWRPDLRDDATIGCLRALLEKVAQGWVSINWSVYKRHWEVRVDHFDHRLDAYVATCITAAEALVWAFEHYDTNKKGVSDGS